MIRLPAELKDVTEGLPCRIGASSSSRIEYLRQIGGDRQLGFHQYTSDMRCIQVTRRVPREMLDERDALAGLTVWLTAMAREGAIELLVNELIQSEPPIHYGMSGSPVDDVYTAIYKSREAAFMDPDCIVMSNAIRDPSISAAQAFWGVPVFRWDGSPSSMFVGPWKSDSTLFFRDQPIEVLIDDLRPGHETIASIQVYVAPVVSTPGAFVQIDLGEPV